MTRDEETVVVAGSGIAGLCASISAAENGARVVLVEKAPYELRGGNGRFTSGNFRYARLSDPYGKKPYPPEKFYSDIMRISGGRANPQLAQMIVSGSLEIHSWMTQQGVEWIVHDDRTKFPNVEFPTALGEGAGMVDYLINGAKKKGVEILFETALRGLLTETSGRVVGVKVADKSGQREIKCGSVVMACGGFEASPEMRAKYLGAEEANIVVRGTRYNTGDGLKIAMSAGAQAVGDWGGYHGCGVCSVSPLVEGGNLKLDDFSRAIVVNKFGKRFFDESPVSSTRWLLGYDDVVNTMTAKIYLRQPEGRVFYIYDSATRKYNLPIGPVPEPVEAPTIRELAIKAGIDPDGLIKTVEEFNASIRQNEQIPNELAGKHTVDIDPPKSSWAVPLDKPPFVAYEHVAGITFTYGGIKISDKGEVLNCFDTPILGLYAAGEMVGDFWYYNYVGAAGLTKSAVEGRTAGKNAALYATTIDGQQ